MSRIVSPAPLCPGHRLAGRLARNNAVEISHHERRWVTLPLDGGPQAGGAGHDGGTESDPDVEGLA